jgi:hypothetical protein
MKSRTTPLLAASAFWLPPEGRWQTIQATAKLAGVEKGGGTFRSAKTSCRNRRMHRDFSLAAANGNLSCLRGGERDSAKPKDRCGPSERARASHWAGVRRRVQRNADIFQHFIHHLSPVGVAGFVLAGGTMSSNQSGDAFEN